MKKTMFRRAMTIILSLACFIACIPIPSAYAAKAEPVYTYDPDAAVAYADKYWDSTKNDYTISGKGVTFVRKCLAGAGVEFTSSPSTPGVFKDYLVNNGYASTVVGDDVNIKDIKKGDVIGVFCSQHGSEEWGLQAFLVSDGYNSTTECIKIDSKNPARHNESVSDSDLAELASTIKCNSCKSYENHYLIHIKMNVKAAEAPAETPAATQTAVPVETPAATQTAAPVETPAAAQTAAPAVTPAPAATATPTATPKPSATPKVVTPAPGTYSPDDAIAFADSKWDESKKDYNISGKCTTFVRKCMEAGGIKFTGSPSTPGVFTNYLINNNYAVAITGDDIDIKNIKKGDALAVFCANHGSDKWGLHVVIVSEGYNSTTGCIKIDAKNRAHHNTKMTASDLSVYADKFRCESCNSYNNHYLVHISMNVTAQVNENTSSEKDTASTAGIYKWAQGSNVKSNTWYSKCKNVNWSKACAIVAIAVQIARTDLVRVDADATTFDRKTMTGFNPATFAKAWIGKGLSKPSGQKLYCSVSWTKVNAVVPGFNAVNCNEYKKNNNGWNYYPADSEESIAKAMQYFLSQGYYPIIEGPGSRWSKDKSSVHYVAVVSATDTDVQVIDPATGKQKSLFDVSIGGNKWTYKNLEKCGKPSRYACCRLYEVDASKLLKSETPALINVKLDDIPDAVEITSVDQPNGWGWPMESIIVEASSELTADGVTYSARNACDGSSNTSWQEGASNNGVGESISIMYSGAPMSASVIYVRPGYAKSSGSFTRNCHPKTLRVTAILDDGSTYEFRLRFSDENRDFFFAVPDAAAGMWMKATFTVEEVYQGTDHDDLAISAIGIR